MHRSTVTFIAFCSVSAGGSVHAQELTNPSWSKPVQAELVQDLYPGFASLIGQNGRATVLCRIEADGHPYICEVIDEAPHGLGFGAAARVIVASAEVKAARLDGRIVARSVNTSVNFVLPEQDRVFGGWSGPEPSPSRLALARRVAEIMPYRPPAYRDQMMDGLDFDRRQLVGEWIDELMPRDQDRENEILVLQLARLFDEGELRRISNGEHVSTPSEADFLAACPEPTPSEIAAIQELKRRYCERWGCDVVPTV